MTIKELIEYFNICDTTKEVIIDFSCEDKSYNYHSSIKEVAFDENDNIVLKAWKNKKVYDLKEIAKLFRDSFYDEEEDELYILSCEVGNNFYDYGEEPRPFQIEKKYKYLLKDPRIHFVDCADCGRCEGW